MAYLIEWQVKAAIIVALLVVVFVVFLSRDAMFKRNRFWLLSALFAPWIVPLIAMPVSVKALLLTPEKAVDLTTLSIPLTTVSNDVNQHVSSIDWPGLILALYLLVSLVFTVRLFWGYASLIKLKRKSKKSEFKGLNLYLLNNEEINPFSFFRSVFVTQSVMEQADRNHILNHERAHCLQWHSVDITLAEWMLILQWWNPFAWWLRKLIAQNHEFCVDKAMMQISDEPVQYQYSLINYLPGGKSLKLVNNFSKSLIKKRIIMMNNKTDRRLFKTVKSFVVVVVTFIVLAAFTNPDKTVKRKNEQQQVENIKSAADLHKFFAQNIKYPVLAVENNITGDVAVNVAIRKNGKVGKAKIGSATGDNVVKLENIVVVGYATESGASEVSSASITDLEEEVKRLMAKLPRVDDVDFRGKTMELKVSFLLQEKEQGADTILSIIYVNGERYQGDINSISPDEIASMNVLKGESAVEKYGDDHKQGVIEIRTKDIAEDKGIDTFKNENGIAVRVDKINHVKSGSVMQSSDDVKVIGYGSAKKSNHKGFLVRGDDNVNPLYIVDGKESTQEDVDKIDADQIESIIVLKDHSAKEQYGEKGKDGVIVITMKK